MTRRTLTPSGCSLWVGSCLPMNSSRTSCNFRLESESKRNSDIIFEIEKCPSHVSAAHSYLPHLHSWMCRSNSYSICKWQNCVPKKNKMQNISAELIRNHFHTLIHFEINWTLEYLWISCLHIYWVRVRTTTFITDWIFVQYGASPASAATGSHPTHAQHQMGILNIWKVGLLCNKRFNSQYVTFPRSLCAHSNI